MITGNVFFYQNSTNLAVDGQICGIGTFYNNSKNCGYISTGCFYDYSENYCVVTSKAYFHDHAIHNLGATAVNIYQYDSSTISGCFTCCTNNANQNTESLGGLSTEQIQALTTEQIYNLTSNQVASLTSNQISSFTTDQVQVLQTHDLVSLTSTQINAFTPIQVSALNTSQISSFTTSQISILTTEQLQAVQTAALQALTTNQIVSLITDQIVALTTSQVSHLSSSQLNALTNQQVQSIETIDIEALTTSQISSLITQQVTAFTTEQIQAIETVDIAALTTKQISSLTIPQVQALTVSQVQAIETQDIVVITTDQLVSFSIEQIAALTTAQACSLTTSQLNALTVQQLQSIDPQNISSLTTSQFASLATSQLLCLTNQQIQAAQNQDIAALTVQQIANIDSTFFAALNSNQISGWNQCKVQSLSSENPSIFDDINKFADNQIQYLTIPQLYTAKTDPYTIDNVGKCLSINKVEFLSQYQIDNLGYYNLEGNCSVGIQLLANLNNSCIPEYIKLVNFMNRVPDDYIICAISLCRDLYQNCVLLNTQPQFVCACEFLNFDINPVYLDYIPVNKLKCLTETQLCMDLTTTCNFIINLFEQSSRGSGLSPSQISFLPFATQSFSATTYACMGKILTSNQYQALSPNTLNSFSCTFFESSTTGQFYSLTNNQICYGILDYFLPIIFCRDIISTGQIQFIDSDFSIFYCCNFQFLNTGKVQYLTTSQITRFNTFNIDYPYSSPLLANDQRRSFTTTQVQSFTDLQISLLINSVAYICENMGLTTTQYQSLTPSQLFGISPNDLNSRFGNCYAVNLKCLSNDQICNVNEYFISNLDECHFLTFDDCQFEFMDYNKMQVIDTCKALVIRCGSIKYIKPNAINGLTNSIIQNLSDSAIYAISAAQACCFNKQNSIAYIGRLLSPTTLTIDLSCFSNIATEIYNEFDETDVCSIFSAMRSCGFPKTIVDQIPYNSINCIITNLNCDIFNCSINGVCGQPLNTLELFSYVFSDYANSLNQDTINSLPYESLFDDCQYAYPLMNISCDLVKKLSILAYCTNSSIINGGCLYLNSCLAGTCEVPVFATPPNDTTKVWLNGQPYEIRTPWQLYYDEACNAYTDEALTQGYNGYMAYETNYTKYVNALAVECFNCNFAIRTTSSYII